MSVIIPQRLEMLLQKYMPGWICESEIGSGTSGLVYRVFRMDGGSKYYAALKWIEYPTAEEAEELDQKGWTDAAKRDYCAQMMQQLQKEINVMSKLQGNSHIVNMEDHYIVPREDIGFDLLIRMELLTPVTSLVQDMTMKDAVQVGIDICEALKDCKAQGVLHRDIKPENIFKNELGNYKLGDFGVSHVLPANHRARAQQGTPLYMAPEVWKEKPYDSRADLYSLGLVLFELFNGQQPPFCDYSLDKAAVEQEREAVQRRLNGEGLLAPMQTTRELLDVILTACEYDANERYEDAEEMLDALREIQLGARENEKLLIVERKPDAPAEEVPAEKKEAGPIDETVHPHPRDTMSLRSGKNEEEDLENEEPADFEDPKPKGKTYIRKTDKDAEIPDDSGKKKKMIILAVVAVLAICIAAGFILLRKPSKDYADFAFKQTGMAYKLSWNGGGEAPWRMQIKNADSMVVYERQLQQRSAEVMLAPSDSFEITVVNAQNEEAEWSVYPEKMKNYAGDAQIARATLYRYKIWPGEKPEEDTGKQSRTDIKLDDTLGKERGTGYFIRFAYQLKEKKAQQAEVHLFYGTAHTKEVVELQKTEDENKYFSLILNDVLTSSQGNELTYVICIDQQILSMGKYEVE